MSIFDQKVLEDAAACSSFMQKVKMDYWQKMQDEGLPNIVHEKELDEILIIAWNSVRKVGKEGGYSWRAGGEAARAEIRAKIEEMDMTGMTTGGFRRWVLSIIDNK